MSMDLVPLGKMVLLVTPTAVKLSVYMGDCPWVHFISTRVWCRGNMSLEVRKIAASSASTAEDMKNLIILEMMRMGLLYLSVGSSF